MRHPIMPKKPLSPALKLITFTAALATLVIFSAYAHALPMTVEFSGSLDTSRYPHNNAPGALDTTVKGSTISGLFSYDSDAAPHVDASGTSYTGYDLFISINNTYNYETTALTISLLSGMWDSVNISANLSALANYGLPPTLGLNIRLDKLVKFDTFALPADWNMGMFYATRTNDVPGVKLTSSLDNTLLAFNIDDMFVEPPAPVPEPATGLLLCIGLIGVVLLKRRMER